MDLTLHPISNQVDADEDTDMTDVTTDHSIVETWLTAATDDSSMLKYRQRLERAFAALQIQKPRDLDSFNTMLMFARLGVPDSLPVALEQALWRPGTQRRDPLSLHSFTKLLQLLEANNLTTLLLEMCDREEEHSGAASAAASPATDHDRIKAWMQHDGGAMHVVFVETLQESFDSTHAQSTLGDFGVIISLARCPPAGSPVTLRRALWDDDTGNEWPLHDLDRLRRVRADGDLIDFLLQACNKVETSVYTPKMSEDQYRSIVKELHSSFIQPSRGPVLDWFVGALEVYEKIYDPKQRYGPIISLPQSSGTGKSKLMRDVALRIPSVTICFRDVSSLMEGWPPRDWPAQEFLLRNHGDNIMAEVVAAALLGGLMEFLTSHVSTLRFSETRADACTRPFELEAKIDEKDSSRYRSFEQVVLRAQVLLQNHAGALPRPQESTGSEWIEWLGNIYSRILHLPLTKLAMQLRLRGHRTFIAGFDECRLLNKPTSSLNTPRSDMSLIALHRVIQAAGQKTIPDFSFWFTFLDTSSSISLLVPRKGVQAPSIRLGGYLEPLPAFPFLGYDQMAPKEPSKTPQEALQVERLRRYGRPLWATATIDIYQLAKMKLFSDSDFLPRNRDHVFAAFTHRVGLELAEGEASSILATEAVRAHMRILLGIVDRTYVITAAPSETMLSLAAYAALNSSEKVYQDAVLCLINKLIDVGLVLDRGMKGELFARLLWTMARDQATGPSLIDNSESVKAVTLAAVLRNLLGEPSGADGMYAQVLQATKSKQMNFTHFVHLKKNVGSLTPKILRKAWDRGCAFHCSHDQPVIDMIFVTYSGDLSKQWDDSKLGTCCVQVKLRTNVAKISVLDQLVGPNIDGTRPQGEVVVLMDLGLEKLNDKHCVYAAAQHPRIPAKGKIWGGYINDEPKRYCIHVCGHDSATYPALAPYGEKIEQALKQRLVYTAPELEKYASEFEDELNEFTFEDED